MSGPDPRYFKDGSGLQPRLRFWLRHPIYALRFTPLNRIRIWWNEPRLVRWCCVTATPARKCERCGSRRLGRESPKGGYLRLPFRSPLRTPEQMEWIHDRFKIDGLERLARADRDYADSHGFYLPDVAALAHAAIKEAERLQDALAALEKTGVPAKDADEFIRDCVFEAWWDWDYEGPSDDSVSAAADRPTLDEIADRIVTDYGETLRKLGDE